jgi:predicted DCC family thiol-disulfide oxidoreductase YuxK
LADLVLYDGVCGLCSRLVQFVLRRDRRDRFRFAPLQGQLAGALLGRHGLDAGELDTVRVVVEHDSPGERVLSKSEAMLHVLRSLGGIWSLARVLALVPTRCLDGLYDLVAARRYRWFGRLDACPVPRPEQRGKFLDDARGASRDR